MKNFRWMVTGMLFWMLLGSGCAELQQLAQIRRPTLNVAGMRMTGLSLQDAGLVFDIDIENPNPVSVRMAGFDYQFKINNSAFLQGDQKEDLTIGAHENSRVAVPVTLIFKNLYETYQSLGDMDSTAYTLACGFTFQLPVLGPTRIPVQKSGYLPLIKIPKISIQSLKLNRLGLSGAELVLELKLDNPNAFQLLISRLNYNFNINGLSWAKGNLSSPLTVNPKNKNTVQIPVSLNFLDMGKTVYQLIQNNQALNYQFDGALGFDTTLPGLNQINLPLNSTGAIQINK